MTPGPFVVTQRRQLQSADSSRVVYREAFATLEEAQGQAIVRAMFACAPSQEASRTARQAILALPESGGKITLPNGDVIEVEATTYDRLLADLPPSRILLGPDPSPVTAAEILAAWNAEHGIGIEARA